MSEKDLPNSGPNSFWFFKIDPILFYFEVGKNQNHNLHYGMKIESLSSVTCAENK